MTPAPGEAAARRITRAAGLVGLAVGGAALVAPELGLRLAGVEAEGRGVGWTARLFGCRDLVFGAGLLRATRAERLDPVWLDSIVLSQVGDLAVTIGLWRAGRLSRRGLAAVVLTAPPTMLAALLARRRLGAR